MAKKKKGKKGKKAAEAAPPPKPLVVVNASLDPNWVTLDMQLRNLSFAGLKFQLNLPVDTPVYVIKRRLVERHGRMSRLVLYKDEAADDCEISNDRLTLQQLGIEGKPRGESPPAHVAIHYDFLPYGAEEPLLLSAHKRSLPEDEAAAAAGGGALR